MHPSDRWAPTPLDRRGMALPVALLALVALTLMVTTVMVTSGSQGAAASAHVDATQSLYDAEAGLQSYVMTAAAAQAAFTVGSSDVSLTGTGRQVRVTRAILYGTGAAPAAVYRTWAVTAEGIRNGTVSGRAITALVRQYSATTNLGLNIQSAITLGGDLDVNGNAFTVNGRSTACRNDAGVQAVQMSDSSRINVSGNENKFNNFTGSDGGVNTTGRAAIDSTSLTRTQLANQVLGNKTLASIVAMVPASKKWCSSTTTCQYKSGSPLANRPLWTGSTTDSVAVIDGNGGEVEVQGGSGLLIITNGSLLMKGNAVFNGIIIVEGNFTLSGTPTVGGAVISLAMTGQNEIIQDESAIANGHVTVQFNQCTVNSAMDAFTRAAAAITTSSTTFAWSEMVR
jgi:Tfp pilus assembly protein PilX